MAPDVASGSAKHLSAAEACRLMIGDKCHLTQIGQRYAIICCIAAVMASVGRVCRAQANPTLNRIKVAGLVNVAEKIAIEFDVAGRAAAAGAAP